jgi:hypothetical protein
LPGVDQVHGVTYDGRNVWFAAGDTLNAFDPASGKTLRSIDVAAHAELPSTASICFSSPKIASRRSIRRPAVCSPPSRRPGGGGDSGLAWAEGTLWVGQYRGPKDPSNRSRDRGDSSHDRVQPLRDRRHLGRRRALARHLGRCRERVAASRSSNGRGPWRSSRCRPE